MEIKDYTILGEILIPLENTMSHPLSNPSSPSPDPYQNLESLFTKDIFSFRSIILENEFLRFFVILKFERKTDFFTPSLPPQQNLKLTELCNSIIFQSELTVDAQNMLNDDEIKSLNTGLNSHGSISTELTEGYINKLEEEKQNNESEYISRRVVIEEKGIVILEIMKHILIPHTYVNGSLVLKVNLIQKKKKTKEKKINLLNMNNPLIRKKKKNVKIKSLLKEVKVIRPLFVSEAKQMDCSPENSIFQIKLENITSTVNFIDNSLKNSMFIKQTNDFENIPDYLNYGIPFVINDIRVLKNETFIDNKMTLNIEKKEQYHQKENLPIELDDVDFELLNQQFPVELKPSEEYNITLKMNKRKEFKLKNLKEKTIEKEVNDYIIINDQFDKKEHNDIKENVGNNNIYDDDKEHYSPNKKSSFFSRFTKGKKDKIIKGKNELLIKNSPLPSNKSTKILSELQRLSKPTNKTQRTKSYYEDQIIKLSLSTPIILSIAPKSQYENMFMTILLKWKTEIFNQMKIFFFIENEPNSIIVNKYFTIKFKFQNISNKEGDFIIQFFDSFENLKLRNEEYQDFKPQSDSKIPFILSELCLVDLGTLSSGEEREISINFLPLKTGYSNLPPFNIQDKKTGKTFFVVHTNKIFITSENPIKKIIK